jgi:hypothetical protein
MGTDPLRQDVGHVDLDLQGGAFDQGLSAPLTLLALFEQPGVSRIRRLDTDLGRLLHRRVPARPQQLLLIGANIEDAVVVEHLAAVQCAEPLLEGHPSALLPDAGGGLAQLFGDSCGNPPLQRLPGAPSQRLRHLLADLGGALGRFLAHHRITIHRSLPLCVSSARSGVAIFRRQQICFVSKVFSAHPVLLSV